MALDTNIVHKETGATAVVSEAGFELVWKDKGWEKVTYAAAVEASKAKREANEQERQDVADAAAKQAAAAFADVGVDAVAAGVVAAPEDKKQPSSSGAAASGSGATANRPAQS